MTHKHVEKVFKHISNQGNQKQKVMRYTRKKPTISDVGEDVEQEECKDTSTVGGHMMACSAELKIYIITQTA